MNSETSRSEGGYSVTRWIAERISDEIRHYSICYATIDLRSTTFGWIVRVSCCTLQEYRKATLAIETLTAIVISHSAFATAILLTSKDAPEVKMLYTLSINL